MDILHQAVWNELYQSMLRWDDMVGRSEANLSIEKNKMNRERLKILDLCARLDAVTKQGDQ